MNNHSRNKQLRKPIELNWRNDKHSAWNEGKREQRSHDGFFFFFPFYQLRELRAFPGPTLSVVKQNQPWKKLTPHFFQRLYNNLLNYATYVYLSFV